MNPTEVANDMIRSLWDDMEDPFNDDGSENLQPPASQELIDAVEAAMKDGWVPVKFSYIHPDDDDGTEPPTEFEIGDFISIPFEDRTKVQPTLSDKHNRIIENTFNKWYEDCSREAYKKFHGHDREEGEE
jgi:hypothetical protein